jgi:hypothetical protein
MESPMSAPSITGQAFTLAQRDTIETWATTHDLQAEVGRDAGRRSQIVRLMSSMDGLAAWSLWRCAWTGNVVADTGVEGAEVARAR